MTACVDIEVLLHSICTTPRELIQESVQAYLSKCDIREDTSITDFNGTELHENVRKITISFSGANISENLGSVQHAYHIYMTNQEMPESCDLNSECEGTNSAIHYVLPSEYLEGLWESLIFDNQIKKQLLSYMYSSLLFSEKNVDWNIVPWNKVILLHGPPGTGKTSLCKALAQKICIQFSHKYSSGLLIEINSHSLFSKWFSESGKLVSKLFKSIQDIVEATSSLIVILIDEVESLAHSRKASFQGNSEPSDSIRVVNALITHLDIIRRYPNVLILTTSNITEAIDGALVDRADIKQYIGLPSPEAIYQIYYSCIKELQRVGIINSLQKLPPLTEYKNKLNEKFGDLESMSEKEDSTFLMEISSQAKGLSGRMIRKTILVAHATNFRMEFITLREFLEALSKTVAKMKEDDEVSELSGKLKKLMN